MNENTVIVKKIRESIEAENQRSAWDKGVTAYALDLLDDLSVGIEYGYISAEDIENPALLNRALLNGASNWEQYSWGGCSLIYNHDIAQRLCCPSEFKRTNYGDRRPNSHEEWLDTQARALYQAANRIKRHARKVVA